MFKLIYQIFRGIIILPLAVVLMILLSNYEDSKKVEEASNVNETVSPTLITAPARIDNSDVIMGAINGSQMQ